MKRLAIFAHFDAQNEVKRYVLHYLEALLAHCDRVIFVSVSDLSRACVEKLKALSCEVFIKDGNVGFDFGMWKLALAKADWCAYEELLLVNSSVLGPLSPLGHCFDRMSRASCDVWSLTDNVEIDWHLQSYFLVFKSRVFHSDAFKTFWNGVLEYRDKQQVIRSYEVGLSIFMREQGFRLEPMFPQAELIHRNPLDYLRFARRRRNPTCAFPADLLRMGMPLVKVELLRDNPQKTRLGPVRREMTKRGYDTSLIEFDRPIRQNGWPYD